MQMDFRYDLMVREMSGIDPLDDGLEGEAAALEEPAPDDEDDTTRRVA